MKTRAKSLPALDQLLTSRGNQKSVRKEKQKQIKQVKQKKTEKQKQSQISKSQTIIKKEKKLPQPKKYLNKNYEQVARIARSQYQKIFLLEAKRQQDEGWHFMVQGTSGSNYRVRVHNTELKCTCTDFRIKRKPCKHLYFIVTQVAQNTQILDYFNNSLKISKSAFAILDNQLLKRLKSRMEKPQVSSQKQIDLKDDTDCTICFTQMNKQSESLENCSTCKKYFHFDCLSAWKKVNSTCPLCRSAMNNPIKTNDPLGKLKNIQIDAQ